MPDLYFLYWVIFRAVGGVLSNGWSECIGIELKHGKREI